jgi:hypothetical protein
MIITYEEIKPYLYQLNLNDNVTLCSFDMFFNLDRCAKCAFDNNNLCMLNFAINQHLPQLVKLLKEKHPELFI